MSQQRSSALPIYDHLGIAPVINACGIYTDLGGSRLSPRVWAAMTEMNDHFVRLPDLLDRTGERIAALLGAPAARIVPGAAAGIALGAAACMAGQEGNYSQKLPQTDGMKSTVIIQAGHRYKYDRQISLTGANLKEIGSKNGTRKDQLAEAISEQTAMILHPAHLDSKPGTLPLEEVAAIAKTKHIPVFVDAAYMNYPVSLMHDYIPRGADLVVLSAKYFGGPNAGGFVMGRKDLIAAVSNVHFTRYESGKYLKFGRPLKMDRQIIVGVYAALEEWLQMDHAARFARYGYLVDVLRGELNGIPVLTLESVCFTMDERFIPEPVNCLLVTVDENSCGKSAADIAAILAADNPSIAAVQEDNKLGFVVDVLEEDEIAQISKGLRAALAG